MEDIALYKINKENKTYNRQQREAKLKIAIDSFSQATIDTKDFLSDYENSLLLNILKNLQSEYAASNSDYSVSNSK